MLFDGPAEARDVLVLAHGAGAAMDSDYMNRIASGVAEADIRVARFEFPYMKKRREDGVRRGPDRAPVLQAAWREAMDELGGPRGLVIGGKSMGGRIASLVADDASVRGLVCLGYPFHPPGRPEQLRTAHLEKLVTPTLILQGTRDPFGGPREVEAYALSGLIEVAWIEDGDHDHKPRKKSGRSHEQNLAEVIENVVAFVKALR